MTERSLSHHTVYRTGSPWENGYVESFNGKLKNELLNRENFDTLLESGLFWSAGEGSIIAIGQIVL